MAIFELLDYIVNEVGFHHLIAFQKTKDASNSSFNVSFKSAASTKAARNI